MVPAGRNPRLAQLMYCATTMRWASFTPPISSTTAVSKSSPAPRRLPRTVWITPVQTVNIEPVFYEAGDDLLYLGLGSALLHYD